MNYRRLGRAGMKVSEVGLGGWLTQGRTISDDTTTAIVRRAFELGVNFFDTADVYHQGESEKSLALALDGLRRDDYVLATKCYFPMSDRPNDQGLSRKHIYESVHNSLRRLRTDYVDLMQFHRFDAHTPIDESIRAVDDLIRQGKVLYWGVSEWKAHHIMDAVHLAKAMNCNSPVSNQPYYNMLGRGIEGSVIPACEQLGLGQVVFSPLAQGVLTGKYLPGHPVPDGSRAADPTSNQFMAGMMSDQALLQRIQDLKAHAETLGLTLPQLALGWCLRQPNVSSVIVGATRVEQMESNIAASGVHLTTEQWEAAEAILEGRA